MNLSKPPEGVIHPDGVRYSGEASAYEHLVELGALSPGDGLAAAILCPWCGGGDLHTLRFMHPHYQGYCVDCGWIELAPDQVTPWRVNYPRIAGWLGAALGVAGRYPVQELVPDVLWRLGELEHRRTRYSLFFGRRWCRAPGGIGR